MIDFLDLYDASQPLPPAVPGAMPFPDFAAELLALYAEPLRAKATLRMMVRAVNVLTELGVTSTADLDVPLIGRLITTRPIELSKNTVRSLLVCVSAVCTYGAKTGRIPINPFLVRPMKSWIRHAEPLPERSNHLTAEECRRLLDLLARDVAERLGFAQWRARRTEALVNLALYSGMRLGEMLWLRVEDVDLEAGILLIVDRAAHRLKTEKSAQPLPIPKILGIRLADWLSHRDDSPPDLVRPPSPYVFRNWKRETPWVAGMVGTKPLDRLKAAAVRAGIKGATFQALRRTVATMMETNCSEAMIQRIMRHSNPSTSRKWYRKFDLENIKRAMLDFDYS